MVSITINAPQRPMAVHRLLSERIIRAVAETYQCEDAEILLAILVKPPELTAGCKPGTVLCRLLHRPEHGTDRRARMAVKVVGRMSTPGFTFKRLAGRLAPRRSLRSRRAMPPVCKAIA
jgi:hypothetical protein